ncbi:uncharacterized protein DUF5063 [Balneicella halophila]|uniref:Uncharacterized protein DUF5063 n=1 Tax=Balneicella halophila TaxID=1537566 RepID=A0A7L4UQE1_BALHA|nr:DUF5063 domain-containing protein [Balneicella halophila]PVX51963.1 uncharacterized protein DUF5063 [Balneicella halophila]
MNTEQHLSTNANVLEFVTVVAEYCAMLERQAEHEKDIFVERMQKLLPLLYLKASLLPEVRESEDGFIQAYVTEDDWMAIFLGLKDKLGEDNEYLEVFDKRIEFNAEPIVVSLAENFADIYQDLRDFLTNFHLGTEELVEEALWKLQSDFTDHWGQYTVNALRAIHHIITKQEDSDEL